MTVEAIADRLHSASVTGHPIDPVRQAIEVLALADGIEPAAVAYAVQQHNVERTLHDRGTHVCGRKIGLTSTAVQQQLGVDEPDFGALFADRAYGDGDTIDTSSMISPRVEPEIALVMRADLDRGQHTVADVIGATDYVLTAIEIVDSRVADWQIRFLDTVADNASGDSFVLGTIPHRLDGLDLSALEISMSIDGEHTSTGAGRDCLGNPLLATRWLADTLSAAGTPLQAGDIVMTGAVASMAPFTPGCTVTADFGPLGTMSVAAKAASS